MKPKPTDPDAIRLHIWACEGLGLPVLNIPLKPAARLKLAIRHALGLLGAPSA